MPSEAMDIDVGQLVYPSLKDCPVVVDLHELSPVGRRATGGRDWRRLERFAQMREDLPDRPRIGNERDESDVATTPRARKRKLLAHPSHEFGPSDPGGVVGGTGSGCAAVGACPSCPAAGDRHLFLRNTSQTAITSKWFLGGRKVTDTVTCRLVPEAHEVHLREVAMETSWGMPPPTFTVETTTQSGTRVTSTRTDTSVGGGGRLEFGKFREELAKVTRDAGWTFVYDV